jgi:hypothetical protein
MLVGPVRTAIRWGKFGPHIACALAAWPISRDSGRLQPPEDLQPLFPFASMAEISWGAKGGGFRVPMAVGGLEPPLPHCYLRH